jgi:tRNA pseudouridine55 synthase
MDGVLVLAKPAGPTSHDMVALVRRLSGTRRVGHGGTLDPFATGVLPLFLGRATRMLEYHLGDAKTYRATVCFGAGSTTDDLEGELTPIEGAAPGREAVLAALERFRGPIVQTPPAFSAVKVGGRRAYALARAGGTPALKPRSVTIERLELVGWDDADPERPIAVIDVGCSAGTYVRALARDLGEALGNAAYLGALVRTASGPFRLDEAHPVDEVRAAAAAGMDELGGLLLRPDVGLERIPAMTLEPDELDAIARGQFVRPPRPVPPPGPDGRLRLLDARGGLVAVAAVQGGRLAPEKVFIDAPRAARQEDELEAELRSERDPDESVDPDPASPDDV